MNRSIGAAASDPARQRSQGQRMIKLACITLVLFFVPVLTTAQIPEIENQATLEAFVDGVMHASMRENHVAGAVVVVTTPDKVLLSKGYGYSDVDNAVSVSADKTLFRIGSVSKLFVWLPLMQLLDAGDIDLDADINSYMKSVQVPDAYNSPVTIKHLMTHTPGFEDHVIGLFGRNEDSMRPLAEILRDEMPTRVRAPGTYASYSNHGVGMAGMIIEDISGLAWPAYVDAHVLEPLGMHNTSAWQPLQAGIESQMSKGYAWEAGRYVEKPFEYVPLGPAGGISASGKDMAIFLRQFLNKGEVDGVRILSRDRSEQMQSVLHRAAGSTNGVLHGFYETSEHGQRIFGHGGDTLWFHSEFMVMPDAGLGFFISTNSAAGPSVRSDFRSAFLDRYFPHEEKAGVSLKPEARERLAGSYGMLRHAHDDLTKIAKLLSPVAVQPMGDGKLMLSGALTGEDPLFFDEVETGVFSETSGRMRMTFDLSREGPATHIYIDSMPVMALERMEGLNSPVLHQSILALVLLVTLWILVVWTVQDRTGSHWHNDVVASFRTRAYLLALLSLVFLVSLSIAASDQSNIVFGLAASVKLSIMLTYLIALVGLMMLWRAPGVLASNDVSRAGKLGYLVVTITAMLWLWFIYYWRLMVFW